jgi:hypothetical protein
MIIFWKRKVIKVILVSAIAVVMFVGYSSHGMADFLTFEQIFQLTEKDKKRQKENPALKHFYEIVTVKEESVTGPRRTPPLLPGQVVEICMDPKVNADAKLCLFDIHGIELCNDEERSPESQRKVADWVPRELPYIDLLSIINFLSDPRVPTYKKERFCEDFKGYVVWHRYIRS